MQQLKEKLRDIAFERGGRLFGVCLINDIRDDFHFEIKESSLKLNRAISIGIPVSSAVLDSLIDRPNMLYKAHYQQINHMLNDIAFLIAIEIADNGYETIPIPASKILKWKPMRAHLSHRVIAHKAGLGWNGRNNLLVTPQYGSQIRLVTVLTNAPLDIDQPLKQDCGDCYACLDACPVGAIDEHQENFNLEKCYAKVSEFARPENIGSYICGLCLEPCRGEKK
ncbi:MAG: hypothetical protein ABIJ45_05360 [Candidatus Zixiibacteriota bacterium]